MITGQLKSDIDRLWEHFWTGGIANPLSVIEQISYLMFLRMLDIRESRDEKRARRLGGKAQEAFERTRVYTSDTQNLRWHHWRHEEPAQMLETVGGPVFAHLRKLGGAGTFGEYMADAQLMIPKASLLVEAVNMVESLPLTSSDTKGDLYEYLLGKLTTAGINGQFRTPRHIIEMMVQLMDPKPDETVCDPACGTSGFLVETKKYIDKMHTSAEGRIEDTDPTTGEKYIIYTGDQLGPYRDHIQTAMFSGFDFDVSMLRIASMNLMLHGIDNPAIHYRDTLSNSFPERYPQQAEDAFDVILANPPFKGSLDEGSVHPSLTRKVKTKKTELLFVALILRMLRGGGRSATVVPDGVLFGSSRAHQALRTMLVDENQLEGVISLPSGVFKPYAGVSTAILIFSKGGRTDDVFFFDVEHDGYSLDDKRDKVDDNDLPAVLEAWAKWKAGDAAELSDRKAKAFTVPAQEIRDNKYDLSINRYKEIEYEEVVYEPPKVILQKLRTLEDEIRSDLDALEGMLG